MQIAEKCVINDELTTEEVLANHRDAIRETLMLLSNCLDALVQAWADEDAAALDKAIDEAVATAPTSVEEALERLEELTAHACELETALTHLKALHLDDAEDEKTD